MIRIGPAPEGNLGRPRTSSPSRFRFCEVTEVLKTLDGQRRILRVCARTGGISLNSPRTNSYRCPSSGISRRPSAVKRCVVAMGVLYVPGERSSSHCGNIIHHSTGDYEAKLTALAPVRSPVGRRRSRVARPCGPAQVDTATCAPRRDTCSPPPRRHPRPNGPCGGPT